MTKESFPSSMTLMEYGAVYNDNEVGQANHFSWLWCVVLTSFRFCLLFLSLLRTLLLRDIALNFFWIFQSSGIKVILLYFVFIFMIDFDGSCYFVVYNTMLTLVHLNDREKWYHYLLVSIKLICPYFSLEPIKNKYIVI